MTELERLASRLPVHTITRREMYLYALKTRVRDVWELNWPILYRYARKITNWIGADL